MEFIPMLPLNFLVFFFHIVSIVDLYMPWRSHSQHVLSNKTMSSNGNMTTSSVELATAIIGKWSETYRWITVFSGFAAFAMAFYTGANNIPIPFSSLIGSGALTFLKSGVIAFVLYVPGTALPSENTFVYLFSKVIGDIQPSESFLMSSMVVVLITSSFWFVIAGYFSLPVSPQHSIWAALLGTALVIKGCNFTSLWNDNVRIFGGGIMWLMLEWVVCPMISCFCSFCFFAFLRWLILRRESGEKTIFVFLPFYFGASTFLLCLFIVDKVIPASIRIYKRMITIAILVATFAGALLSLVFMVPLAKTRTNSTLPTVNENPSIQASGNKRDSKENSADNTISEHMQMRYLHTVYEEDEHQQSWVSPKVSPEEIFQVQCPPQIITKKKSAALLESIPNLLPQQIGNNNSQNVIKKRDVSEILRSVFFPVIKCDRNTLIRHALAEKFDEIEELLRFPHILASCVSAIVQCVIETSALMIPFQEILNIFHSRSESSTRNLLMQQSFDDCLTIDPRIRSFGGLGASLGFMFFGWRVTQSLASDLTYVSNSRGSVFQLSAAFGAIIVSRMRLPVSCVHASVAALVGVGIADNPLNVNWKLLLRFVIGWVMTVVFCCAVAYVIFYSSVHSPAYVVVPS